VFIKTWPSLSSPGYFVNRCVRYTFIVFQAIFPIPVPFSAETVTCTDPEAVMQTDAEVFSNSIHAYRLISGEVRASGLYIYRTNKLNVKHHMLTFVFNSPPFMPRR